MLNIQSTPKRSVSMLAVSTPSGAAGWRRPSLLTYWLTCRSSLLRAGRPEGLGTLHRRERRSRPRHFLFAESLPLIAQPFEHHRVGAQRRSDRRAPTERRSATGR